MAETLNVIKVGGAVVEDEASLGGLIARFASLPGRKVLVHGGGRSATRLAGQLGIETTMVEGRRVTDEAMLRVVTMVYGGLVNKHVVARLQAAGVNALGMTGADMNVIRAHRRGVKVVRDAAGREREVDYGFVGDIDGADGGCLARLVESGVTPVVAPLAHDGRGQMLNVNADTIAATVAVALAEHFDVTLTYCFEKAGVLARADDEGSVIRRITREDFGRLVSEGVISGGMVPKVENALGAIERGVRRVVITGVEDIEGSRGTVVEAPPAPPKWGGV